MPRTIPDATRTALEAVGGEDLPLVFLKFTHGDLADVILVVSDIGTEGGEPVEWQFRGENYVAFPFDIKVITDNDGPPRGEITVANVDQRIGKALRAIKTPLSLSIYMLLHSDFDTSVNPRVPLSYPTPFYEAHGFTVRDVSVDVIQITGTIRSFDDTGEPYPGLQSTQALLPGLYR